MRTALIALLALVITGAAIIATVVAQAAPATALPAAELAVPAQSLPATEAAALTFMREEEKLARDVYQALATTWSLPVFTNIAASEQTHMDALKTLLDRYGLADPAATTAQGVFTDPALQALYTELMARGTSSLPEALAVGAAIEEIDILDLQARTTAATPADIARVYAQLTQGSENHLRAFVGQWETQTGETYQPQKLDNAAYQTIIAGGGGTNGNGNGAGAGAGNGNGGGHGNGGGRGRP